MKCFHYFKDKYRSKEHRSFKSSSSAASPRSISELDEAKALNLRVFSFSELRKATRNFSPELMIGEGGFGIVYKGIIEPADEMGEPLVVAIKKHQWKSYSQGHKEWLAEVQFLGVLEHPNVVKLIGHCTVDGERGVRAQHLLVYEFMRNKSLDDHLFGQAFPPLPWITRLQIILGAARALAYLHEGFKIIHRSFRPSDVLLDEKFNPKLSDFGLAREGPMAGDEHVSTGVMGVYGYIAPEYAATGHLTYKSEVWSFGVVLYEILSGRRSFDRNRPTSERSLVEWVKRFPAKRKRFRFIMDPRLENQYSIGEALEIAKLADDCLSTSPQERPKMSEVVERLTHIIPVSEEGSAEKTKNHPEASEKEAAETKKKSNNQVSETSKRQMTHIAEESIQGEDTSELLTIKYALESFLKAERKGKVLLIIESDSVTAVKWIEDVESRPRKLWAMLKEIDSLISRTGTVVFKILPKEADAFDDCLVEDEVVRSYKCTWW